MKWTTLNCKNANYTENHEIYVGTHTGSFKKLRPANEEYPFAQRNLYDFGSLDKDAHITALAFGNEEQSEILIGRGNATVELHSLCSEQIEKINVQAAPVVGLARYENQLIAAIGTGQVQRLTLSSEVDDATVKTIGLVSPMSAALSAGDDISHMRQCAAQRNLVATGGKGRPNNLKVFDMAAGGKQVFSSKNLPNDYLQLEVPIWDSDVGFVDAPHSLATCSRYGYVRVYDTRKQRRPVQCYTTEDQMSFATLVAHDNYIYTGTTTGALKAFDIRRMKTFVHTYKGFTGSISDLQLDATGKYLTSASLDRYVRVHHVDSCVLLYQCYVKSKALRVLIRESMEKPSSETGADMEQELNGEIEITNGSKRKSKAAVAKDDEYDDIFDNMQTVCEKDDDETEHHEDEVASVDSKAGSKRKSSSKVQKNNKKRN